MTRKQLIYLFFLSLPVFILSKPKSLTVPPNGIRLDDTIFIDKTEVSNLDYREYCYWIERVLGKDSVYKALPDEQNIWSYKFARDTSDYKLFDAMLKYYFTHPQYNAYPVVGITYQQALGYCKWRSDRTYEISLIKANIIEPSSDQNRNNYFTIEGFLNGSYKVEKKNTDKIPGISIFRFRLPTIEEFEQANNLPVCELIYPKWKIHYSSFIFEPPYSPVNQNCTLFISNNLSELTNVIGIAYGQNWLNTTINNIITEYTEPMNCLGFRCVAILEKK